MSRKTQNILALSASVLGLILAVGAKTFLRPCVHADGSPAACAGVGDTLFWLSLILAAAGALFVLARGTGRTVSAAGMVILSGAVALTPGKLQPICEMAQMRCRLVTRPGALVGGVLCAGLSLAAFAGALLAQRRGSKK